jgi:hypothetical protein
MIQGTLCWKLANGTQARGSPHGSGPIMVSLLSENNCWVNAQRVKISGGMALQKANCILLSQIFPQSSMADCGKGTSASCLKLAWQSQTSSLELA